MAFRTNHNRLGPPYTLMNHRNMQTEANHVKNLAEFSILRSAGTGHDIALSMNGLQVGTCALASTSCATCCFAVLDALRWRAATT